MPNIWLSALLIKSCSFFPSNVPLEFVLENSSCISIWWPIVHITSAVQSTHLSAKPSCNSCLCNIISIWKRKHAVMLLFHLVLTSTFAHNFLLQIIFFFLKAVNMSWSVFISFYGLPLLCWHQWLVYRSPLLLSLTTQFKDCNNPRTL